MITPGLVSITFRQLKPDEIIDLVRKTGLSSIEWGGDIHVPHGEAALAREVRKQTADAGITVAAYGSYYRVGTSEEEGLSFGSVLSSAIELGAPTIRVWAGRAGSADTDPAARMRVVEETRRIAEAAFGAGVTISFEYHPNTLTDTNESAVQLLGEVDHPNVFTLWQPPVGESVETCLAGIEAILPALGNLHVYSWSDDGGGRLPLEEHEERWKRYLQATHSADKPRHALLEFVKDNEPENFIRDAATLKGWLDELS